MSFQEKILELAPWWLKGPIAGAILEAVGAVLDAAVSTLEQGIKASNPLTCNEDALAHIGVDRQMRRYPTEPVASYRVRLSQWRQARKLAGSHRGEMMQLQPYFLPAGRPRIRVVHQAGNGSSATWHTLDRDGSYSVHRAEPSNWNWDGATAHWSRFWVIIYVDELGLAGPILYDDGANYDEGHIWDGYLDSAQIADLVSIINDWKAAHSILWGVILAKDPAMFDPTGSGAGFPAGDWGWYIDPVTGATTRPESAIYSYDLGAIV